MKNTELPFKRKNMHCIPEPFTIARLNSERNIIDENPEYQRESGVWSPEKKELFIDSLINGYDIPKIYFHDLRDKRGQKDFSIVDGKQRITTIYEFLNGEFPLGTSFKLNADGKVKNVTAGNTFKDFSEVDKDRFKSISLPIIAVQNATPYDIDELFSRLNNGEPLNAAESRNAFGGKMAALIREVAKYPFFTKKMKLKDHRYSYYEIAAKFLLLEWTHWKTNEMFSDLKKRYLDGLVKDNKHLSDDQKSTLSIRVKKVLLQLNKVFSDNDPLLAKPAYLPMYYLFVKHIVMDYGHKMLPSYMKRFLTDFEVRRQQNLQLPEGQRNVVLYEYNGLITQGTNDILNIKRRVSLLTRFFLIAFPDVELLDKRRQYNMEERFAIYELANHFCTNCNRQLQSIDEMEADHSRQHRFGGPTTLKNGRCLCSNCNEALKEKMK